MSLIDFEVNVSKVNISMAVDTKTVTFQNLEKSLREFGNCLYKLFLIQLNDSF